MSLESATFISGLDATNPLANDQIKQGDDHIRLIKTVLQGCFPNADKAFYFPDSVTKTGNYTVLAADMGKGILADTSGGAFNLTLPTLAASDDGWSVRIIKSDSSTTAVTIVGTVNGVVNPTISKQYQTQFVFWSGTAWYAVGALVDPTIFVSKDAGAGAGPNLDLFRDSASPAASDFLGTVDFNGRDDLANKQLYAQIGAQIADPTSTSEDAIIILRAVIAGVLTDMLQSNSSGILVPGTLNANGNFAINTNKFTVDAANGNTGIAGKATFSGLANFAAAAYASTTVGDIEYDGKAFAVNSVASDRGIIPAVHFLSLSADQTGANSTTAQTWFPGGGATQYTAAAATSYYFKGLLHLVRSAGTTAHQLLVLFGGTATFTSLSFTAISTTNTGNALSAPSMVRSDVATITFVTPSSSSATENNDVYVEGIIRVNGAGTIIPQFKYDVAPGGAPTVKANSYFQLYPVGTNTVLNVGNWN